MALGEDHGRKLSGKLVEFGAIVSINLLWALCYPVLTIAVTDTPPLSLAFVRSILAGATLVGLGLWLKRPFPKKGRLWLILLGIGLTSTAMGFGGMFMAGGRISPGIATVLANSQPLLASIMAVFILGERPGRNRLIGLGVGFIGIVVTTLPEILRSGEPTRFLGLGFVIMGATGVAIGNVLLKLIANDVDNLMAIGIQFLFGSLSLFVMVCLLNIPVMTDWSLQSFVAITILAWPGTALVFLIWYWLLARNELNRINAFTFLTPIFALIMGRLAFEERIGPVQLLGIGLTLLGVYRAGYRSGAPNEVRIEEEE